MRVACRVRLAPLAAQVRHMLSGAPHVALTRLHGKLLDGEPKAQERCWGGGGLAPCVLAYTCAAGVAEELCATGVAEELE